MVKMKFDRPSEAKPSLESLTGTDLQTQTASLREFYDQDSKVGKVLDRLLKDSRKGKYTKTTAKAAKSVLKDLGDPRSSAFRIIRQHLGSP